MRLASIFAVTSVAAQTTIVTRNANPHYPYNMGDVCDVSSFPGPQCPPGWTVLHSWNNTEVGGGWGYGTSNNQGEASNMANCVTNAVCSSATTFAPAPSPGGPGGLGAGAGAGIAVGGLAFASAAIFYAKGKKKEKKGALLGNEYAATGGDRV